MRNRPKPDFWEKLQWCFLLAVWAFVIIKILKIIIGG